MKKIIALFLLAAPWISAASAQPDERESQDSRLLFTQVEPILQGLSEITGWKIRHKVPADYISKDHLRQFVEKRIKEVVKPEDLRIQTLVLRMFGLVPDDFDLEKATIELMTEQAAAFYDYDRKKLFITESSASFLEQRVALVHELAHALADQNFSLGRYIRKGHNNDDSETAREAVMEGQATWLMWAYVAKLGGGEAKVSDIILESMGGSSSSATPQYPVFDKAPLYMRESLLFPYTRGLLFQNAVFLKSGKEGFSEVFRQAPTSTQQILHPELYFEHRDAVKVEPPKPPREKLYKAKSEGAVGEFDFHVLIQQYVNEDKAKAVAPHWRGGAYRLYESKKGRRPVLAHASEWDSPDAARAFFDQYKVVLERRSSKFSVTRSTATSVRGITATGGFLLQLDGTHVSSIEGLPEDAID